MKSRSQRSAVTVRRLSVGLIPLLIAGMQLLGGCQAAVLAGGIAQNIEYQKQIDVPAMYDGLQGRKVAVLVEVNMAMMYEHPALASQIALLVANAIQQRVDGAMVLNPERSLNWQYATPNWTLMALSDVADTLGVDRLVIVDIYEYRLHPPGNRYQWDGVCAANVRVVETDERALDPNSPVDDFQVIARFPEDQSATAYSTPRDRIETGLIIKFAQQTAWLFYDHLEPKYPDKYRADRK